MLIILQQSVIGAPVSVVKPLTQPKQHQVKIIA